MPLSSTCNRIEITTGGFGRLDAKVGAERQKAQERQGRPRGDDKRGPIQKKIENLDNYSTLARATEEKLQQMAERVETTDKEREKFKKKDMEVKKKRYETVNDKLWSLQT